MVPYIVLLIIPLLLLMPVRIRGQVVNVDKRNERAIVAFFVILLFLICFRDESIGADTMQYKYHFEKISELQWSEVWNYGYEIGFVVLYKLVASIFKEYRAVMIIVALLSFVPIAMLYRKNNKNAYVAIVFFITFGFAFGAFAGARQPIALAIIALAYPKIKEKKFWHFLCAVLIALLFHQSAFFALFLYPLYHVKLKMKDVMLFLTFVGGVFIFRKQIFSVAMRFAGTKFYERYSEISDTGAYTMMSFYLILSVFIFITTTRKTREKECSGLLNYLLFATVVQVFASIAHGITRINEYFVLFIPLLMAEVLDKPLPQYKHIYRCFKYGVCILFTAYFYYSLTTKGVTPYNIYPYKFSGK